MIEEIIARSGIGIEAIYKKLAISWYNKNIYYYTNK